jgi:uncharacterized protein YqjF (DUF2071 family)
MADRVFLTAEWRNVAMLNYAVDPAALRAMVPRGTELDQFGGKTYISLVAFRFLRTRVRGIWIPFHSDFDEVNLRFYVRRIDGGTVRRGVVFVREVVPRFAVAKVARLAFHENYISLPMRHKIEEPVSEFGRVQVEYGWRYQGKWSSVRMECEGRPGRAPEGSLEQFITEHYWGYSAQPDGSALEYQVEHVPWRVWKPSLAKLQGDTTALYGAELGAYLNREADSAFLVDGSAVSVHDGKRIGDG